MSNDWTDPDEAERELERREASNGEPNRSAQQDRELLLEIREELKELKTENASLREDIASLRHEVAKRGDERSAPGRPPTEDGLGKRLAETEGRIVGHVDRLDESVRPVVDALPVIQETARIAAAVPETLRNLDATVGQKTKAIQGQILVSKSSSHFLDQLGVDLKDMVREVGLRLEARFAAEAKETREWHKEVIGNGREAPPALEAVLAEPRGRRLDGNARLRRRWRLAPVGARTNLTAGPYRRIARLHLE